MYRDACTGSPDFCSCQLLEENLKIRSGLFSLDNLFSSDLLRSEWAFVLFIV